MNLQWKTAAIFALAVTMSPAFADDARRLTYLALGDSIPFGFNPTLFSPLAPPPRPSQFTGYPEIVAGTPRWKKFVNAACPGETSASFIAVGAPDNGCNGPGPQGQPPFKPSIGLRANYTGSQLAFAVSQLRANKSINLLTLSIGGNDLSLLEARCGGPAAPGFAPCVAAGLPGVLQSYGANLAAILNTIRVQAGYKGKLVLVTYYAPDASPLTAAAVSALNQTMTQIGSGFGARVANGFGAFQLGSALTGGDPCAAGLLIRLSATACDIHPSPKGRNLLAAAVLLSAGVRRGDDDDDE
jgi:lysophospholipase L1-like esterase